VRGRQRLAEHVEVAARAREAVHALVAPQRAQHAEVPLLVRGLEHERERHLEHVFDFHRVVQAEVARGDAIIAA
jgi:hypothetical protein